ncbi:MAG TPA: DegT/DnrJ/EryC1/StrS family aminotransferase, partial [Bryobacteraceae bacterium]|nr:DegT/DnrJ/EryC1/StrS family aminotransferase [Bryobacteraceae bacterium]
MERRKLLIGLAAAEVATHRSARGATTAKPAMLGGTPVRTEAFPSWPITDDTEERALTGVLRSGKWGRGVG